MSHLHPPTPHHGPNSHSHIPPYSPYSPNRHPPTFPPPPSSPSSSTVQHTNCPYSLPSYGYHHPPPPPPLPFQYYPPPWPTSSMPSCTTETPRDLSSPPRKTKWQARVHDNGWSGYHEERQEIMQAMEGDHSVYLGYNNHTPYPPLIRSLEETQHIPIPHDVHLPSWAAQQWILALRPTPPPSNLPTREISITYTHSLLPRHVMHITSRPLIHYDPRAWPLEFYENAYTIPCPPAWRTPAQRDARPALFKAWEAKEHNRAMEADERGRWTRWVRTAEKEEGLMVRWKAKPREEIERKTGAVPMGWKPPVAMPVRHDLPAVGKTNAGGKRKKNRGRTWEERRRKKRRAIADGDALKIDDREGRMRSSSTPSVTAAPTGPTSKAELATNNAGFQVGAKRKGWAMTADGGDSSSSIANAGAAAAEGPLPKVPRWEGANKSTAHFEGRWTPAPAPDSTQAMGLALPEAPSRTRGQLGGMSQEVAAALEALVPAKSARVGLDNQQVGPQSSEPLVDAVTSGAGAVRDEEAVRWLNAMGTLLAERTSGSSRSEVANGSEGSVAVGFWGSEGSTSTRGGRL